MSFLSVDGKIMKCENGFPKRKVNTLTYQVKGTVFPEVVSVNFQDRSYFLFRSTKPNSLVINYGDGTVLTRNFELDGGYYILKYSDIPGDDLEPWYIPYHTFNDPQNTGIRNITFQFQNPLSIDIIRIIGYRFTGSLPVEINAFTSLISLWYNTLLDITNVPDKFPPILEDYTINSSISTPKNKIEDSVFSSRLIILRCEGTYDLSDNISSNFFKINQIKSTLQTLELPNCNNYELPTELNECLLLSNLRLVQNKYDHIPDIISHLPNLVVCFLGSSGTLVDNSIPIMNADKLERLALLFTDDIDFSDIPTSFAGLYSLNRLESFNSWVRSSNTRFNEFINHFYTLITNEANITQDPNAFGGQYPYRFRNISWGDGSLSFTGVKQAPAGYVQGVNNGTPANEGEKVYVMQNQYGHVIDHA